MIDYIINKEKRTVVALMRFKEREETFKNSDWIYDELTSTLGYLKYNGYYPFKKYRKGEDKMFFPRVITAKAKCNPNDEWDEEIGKELAYERLVEKIRKYRSDSYKIIGDITKEIDSIVNW